MSHNEVHCTSRVRVSSQVQKLLDTNQIRQSAASDVAACCKLSRVTELTGASLSLSLSSFYLTFVVPSSLASLSDAESVRSTLWTHKRGESESGTTLSSARREEKRTTGREWVGRREKELDSASSSRVESTSRTRWQHGPGVCRLQRNDHVWSTRSANRRVKLHIKWATAASGKVLRHPLFDGSTSKYVQPVLIARLWRVCKCSTAEEAIQATGT